MKIRQVPPRDFPSRDSRYIAMLDIDEPALSERSGLVFEEEDGQHDRQRFAYVQLSSGQLVLLMRFLHQPREGMLVLADVEADGAACRQLLLRELGLTEPDILWRPEAE